MSTGQLFVISEVAKLSKLTETMLDYLCRTEVLVPSAGKSRGRGCKRYYSFGDVVMARALARLLESGISVGRLKRSLIQLRRHHPEITPDTLPAALLVTDGRSIFFRESSQVMLELSKGQMAFAFILELNAVREEVRQGVAKPQRKKRRAAA